MPAQAVHSDIRIWHWLAGWLGLDNFDNIVQIIIVNVTERDHLFFTNKAIAVNVLLSVQLSSLYNMLFPSYHGMHSGWSVSPGIGKGKGNPEKTIMKFDI